MSTDLPPEKLAANLASVRARIEQAAIRAKRAPKTVSLVAVTKYAGPAAIPILLGLGVKEIGESRVQAAEPKAKDHEDKFKQLRARLRLIGHLQTNKARQALQIFQAIDAVDSLRLLEALGKEARKLGLKNFPIMAEVNISGEEQKHGLRAGELKEFLAQAAAWPELSVTGLMTMAPLADNPAETERLARPVFRGLRELLEQVNAEKWSAQPLTDLSMGMTNDFEFAIEEGATHVRIGSALFTE